VDVPKTYHPEKIKVKPCCFPNCEEYFCGTGFSKYCPEHRKREYRKIIDKLNKKVIITENPNQFYKHDLVNPGIVKFECLLCKFPFEVMVYPNIYIYPKYCESHRNEYKRNLWIRLNPSAIEIISAPVIVETHETEKIIELPDTKTVVMDDDTFIDYLDDFAFIDNVEEGKLK
jgi:hypothetical protein